MTRMSTGKRLMRLLTSSEALLLLMVVIWGVMFPIIKVSLEQVSPSAFASVRYTLATLTLVLVQLLRRQRVWVDRRDAPRVIVLALLGYSLYPLAFIGGLALTSANNSSLILSGTPVLVALIATLLGRERHGWQTWIGILGGFLGIAVIVWGSGTGAGQSSVRGDLLIAVATGLWSLHTVFIRPLLRRYSSLTLTTAFMLIGTPGLVLGVLSNTLRQDWHAVSLPAWLGMLYAGILAGALAYCLWNVGVERVGSTRTATFYNLTPVVTIIATWAMLGEQPGWRQLVGGAAILGGVWLAGRDQKPETANGTAAQVCASAASSGGKGQGE
jgi:drug/metabolite transporter (DMT)-like permease